MLSEQLSHLLVVRQKQQKSAHCPTVHTCRCKKYSDILEVTSKYSLFGLWDTRIMGQQGFLSHFEKMVYYSQVEDPEKRVYLMRNNTRTVIWILNDQNSSKCSLEES